MFSAELTMRGESQGVLCSSQGVLRTTKLNAYLESEYDWTGVDVQGASPGTTTRAPPSGRKVPFQLQACDLPAFAVGFAQVSVCFLDVVEAQFLRVPVQRGLMKTHRHAAEKDGLGQGARVVETRARR